MIAQEDQQLIYRKKQKITLIGTSINFVLMIITYLVAKLSGSSALFADAMHTISDYFTDLIVLVGIKISTKLGKDYLKIEYPLSIFIAFVIMSIGMITIYDSSVTLYQILSQQQNPFSQYYYWASVPAFFTIIVKEWIFRYTLSYAKKFNSPILKANAYHHRTDSYTSIGVLVGTISSLVIPSISFIDPLVGIVVGLFVIKLSFKIFQSDNNHPHPHHHHH